MTDEPTDIVTRLRGLWQDNDCTSTLMDQAADEIERLRKERDEARREACRWMAEVIGGTPEEHAAEMGWDCWNRPGNV